jgi:hypothetical protein
MASPPALDERSGRPAARLALVLAAGVGFFLLLVLAVYRWDELGDSHSYWLAGRAIIEGRSPYELTTGPVIPFAYRYPPPLAQVMAPVSVLLGAWPFEYVWLASMAACLAWMGGWRLVVALALVALLPVAVEFWFRNVHLQLAVLTVLALRRWPALFGVGMLVKLSPAVGIVYLAAARRWRAVALAVGAALLVGSLSWILAPWMWTEFIDLVLARGLGDESGILPIPYAARLIAAVILAAVAGRLGGARGEALAFVAIGIGLPTLWLTGFSFFVGLVVWLPELTAGWRARRTGMRPASGTPPAGIVHACETAQESSGGTGPGPPRGSSSRVWPPASRNPVLRTPGQRSTASRDISM